jgi:hypothetical protein
MHIFHADRKFPRCRCPFPLHDTNAGDPNFLPSLRQSIPATRLVENSCRITRSSHSGWRRFEHARCRCRYSTSLEAFRGLYCPRQTHSTRSTAAFPIRRPNENKRAAANWSQIPHSQLYKSGSHTRGSCVVPSSCRASVVRRRYAHREDQPLFPLTLCGHRRLRPSSDTDTDWIHSALACRFHSRRCPR